MSDSSEIPWSHNPNAPQIPSSLHVSEQLNFIGDFIAAIFYGVIIVLFFQCMESLFNPANRVGGKIKWGLVAHTAAMFTVATIGTAMGLTHQSNSYINNRDFPGSDELPLGPIGYKDLVYSKAISVIPNFMFLANQWLADALLLYRCYAFYNMNFWVVAFPCLMYVGSLVMGILYTRLSTIPGGETDSVIIDFGIPYFSISLALNVILTFMIVVRLVLHARNFQNTTGAPARATRLYKTIVTILVESCSLYAISFILFIGPWWGGTLLFYIFWPVLTEIQVIAPFLIILRVANRTALTHETIASGVDSIRFQSQRTTADGGETLPEMCSLNSVNGGGDSPGELKTETVVDLHPGNARRFLRTEDLVGHFNTPKQV